MPPALIAPATAASTQPSWRLAAWAGIKHDMELLTGPVAQTIVDTARRGKFDLMALGSKGRGAVADLLLGSVAHRVLATAGQPVLVVR